MSQITSIKSIFLAVQYRALMYFNSFHMLELSCLSIASSICNLGLIFLNKRVFC